jgi:hypothetical protein
MNIEDLIFAMGMFGFIFSLILYVAFGQTTVKKLRKNPETTSALGLQFASGWDIFNAAQALALSKYITRKLAESPIESFDASRELLGKNTSIVDKYLAFIFYWLFVVSIISILSLALV